MTATRRAAAPILSVFGLIALFASAPALIGSALAQNPAQDPAQNPPAQLVSKPVSLPDMAVGTAKASVTIVEYASMTCPHCAAFEQNVFPMLRSKYIDTGKVRFIFREFPLDIKAAAASMVARCMAGDDAEKYFAAIDLLFKQQDELMEHTTDTLKRVGKQAGMDDAAVEACEKNQALLDKLRDDQAFAYETLKVDATPTIFVNGERLRGAMSFEELEERIKPLLKK